MRGLLVDTNVIVWLLLGDRPRVSETARLALEDERNRVVVSAATVWEIAVKRSVGKLTIEDGWSRALTRLGFDALPVTSIHAEAVEHLRGITAIRSTGSWSPRRGPRISSS